jgi:hypothetical protein
MCSHEASCGSRQWLCGYGLTAADPAGMSMQTKQGLSSPRRRISTHLRSFRGPASLRASAWPVTLRLLQCRLSNSQPTGASGFLLLLCPPLASHFPAAAASRRLSLRLWAFPAAVHSLFHWQQPEGGRYRPPMLAHGPSQPPRALTLRTQADPRFGHTGKFIADRDSEP